jgi:phospholipid/cholesterol/gamma-HCH transport system permease protein
MEQRTEHLYQAEKDQSGVLNLKLSGSWQIGEGSGPVPLPDILTGEPGKISSISIDGGAIGAWDSRLIIFIRSIEGFAAENKIRVVSQDLPKGVRDILDLARVVPERKDTQTDPDDDSILTRLGSTSVEITRSYAEMIEFIGSVAISVGRLLRGKARYRISDLWLYMQEAGAQALPIVTFITFLIGTILAFIGAVQLRMFGAQIYIADLVGIAMVREMAPMMTAIILAGRNGAAYAAQLGTMMVNEEIDAFRIMGIPPVEYLVLPRILALGLMMPLLTLYGDFMGIAGGMTIAVGMYDVSFMQYFEQTRQALGPVHFFLGLIKGTIYGVLVAIAGCMRGMQSGRNASAVGAAATSAVVTAIVFIVGASAITTVIYSLLGY